MKYSLLICLLFFTAASSAEEAAAVTPTASVEELRKIGYDAMQAKDYSAAEKALRQILKRDRKDRLARILLREARQMARKEATDKYAASVPEKIGIRLGATAVADSGFGGGLEFSWQEPDPAKVSWGVRLSGAYVGTTWTYSLFNYVPSSVSPAASIAHDQQIWLGRLELEWLPGHGRGRRNRPFFLLGAGLGYLRNSDNIVEHDGASGVDVKSVRHNFIERSGLSITVGGGFSSKYGFDFTAGASAFYYGQSLDRFLYGIGLPNQLFASLGYLF